MLFRSPENKAKSVEAMFDRISGKYDRMNRLLTFRLDVAWRKAAVREIEGAPNALVIDLACGTGDMCNDLHAAGYTALGFDFSMGMLCNASTTAPLTRADVLQLPLPDSCVDAVTCGFALRNFTGIEPFFAECARVLRPGGRLVVLDAGEPKSKILRFGHSLYFRKLVPFIGGLLSDRAAYSYLPASTAYLPEPHVVNNLIRTAGFRAVVHRRFGFGAIHRFVGTRT